MADHDPLDTFLQHSDTDESVVNALVASLESRLASPTNKDHPPTLSNPSVNSNHVNSTSNNSACTASSTPISAQNKSVYLPSDTVNTISANAKQVIKGNQILGINSIHSSPVVTNVHSPVNSLRTSSPKPVQNINKPSSPAVHVISQTPNHGSGSVITTIVQHSTSSTVLNSINSVNNLNQVANSNIKSVQITNSGANPQTLKVQADSRNVASPLPLVSSQPGLKNTSSVVVNSTSQPVTQITNVHIVQSANVTSIIPSHVTNPSIIAVRGQMPSTVTPMTAGRQHVVSHVVNASSPRPQGNVRVQPSRMPNTPIRIAASTQPNQINIAPRPGGPSGTITLQPGIVSSQGAVLMKNEHGQLVIVQQGSLPQQPVSSSHPNSAAPQRLPSGQILTIQPGGQPQTVVRQSVPKPVNTTRPQPGVRVSLPQNVHTVVGGSTPGAVTSVAHTQATGSHPAPVGHAANQQQQMLENVKKCKNFLSTLIKLAASQPEATVSSVRDLIQGLIDGKLEPELFTEQLQKELKSSPQPYLVPFLKKSLPLLRQSLLSNKMSIDGVRPPPLEVVQQQLLSSSQSSSSIHHTQNVPKTAGTSTFSSKPSSTQHMASHSHKPVLTKQVNMIAGNVPSTVKAFQSRVAGLTPSSSPGPSHSSHKEKKKFESLKDDDDINDVATMGGVNLTEESRNILATNAEYIGTQIRSCKDEAFLFHGPLLSRITAIANKHGIAEVPTDVINLVSHATQERLRHIVEKLSTIAEQRTEIYKVNDKFEPSIDVKSQLKFIEELDVLERKRHDEQEKEMLRRAAKSRSKHEDPEHLKLKQRAKDLQHAEMEEVRQREANLTALAAIGPRKKRKIDNTDTVSNTPGSSISNGLGSTARPSLRPRIKRVNLRDLLFLMEQDKTLSKSSLLYRTLLR